MQAQPTVHSSSGALKISGVRNMDWDGEVCRRGCPLPLWGTGGNIHEKFVKFCYQTLHFSLTVGDQRYSGAAPPLTLGSADSADPARGSLQPLTALRRKLLNIHTARESVIHCGSTLTMVFDGWLDDGSFTVLSMTGRLEIF